MVATSEARTTTGLGESWFAGMSRHLRSVLMAELVCTDHAVVA